MSQARAPAFTLNSRVGRGRLRRLMKVFSVILIWFLGAWAASAQIPAAKLHPVQLFGHDYVSLDEFARLYDFRMRHSRGSADVQMANRWAVLRFTVDSNRAEINGVNVWFSYPVAGQNDAVYVSLLDLKMTLQPILFPPKSSPPARVRTICLDPGHGGKDPGNEVGRYQEKQFALLLAKAVRDLLVDAGLRVILTRASDSYPELPARPALARAKGADMFVCLHFNSGPAEVKGSEVYCLTPAGARSTNDRGDRAALSSVEGNRWDAKNTLLAYEIQRSLVRSLGQEDRGMHRARFEVLRLATVPAVLVESGFMTHPEEMRRIADPAWRQRLARAIVDGLLAYRKLVER